MTRTWTRRAFVQRAAGLAAATAGLRLATQGPSATARDFPPAEPHTLTIIAGNPRQRGREYGRHFKDQIAHFLDKEIYGSFVEPKATTKEAMLRYADACGRAVRDYSPTIWDETEGMAESAGIRAEEAVLISLHEELWHRGVLPSVDHCTVAAAGPPETADGHAYVGQTWDWMPSVYGQSQMLLWKRPEGPSLLSYAYPGLWAGAGLNSAGIALCWTSATDSQQISGPRVGIPSYALIAQMLYQDTLEAAVAEAKRATHAGWFMFVLVDGEGRIANVEGSPNELAVEYGRGHMGRHTYGTCQMTRTPEGQPRQLANQARHLDDLLAADAGRIDLATIQADLADHAFPICKDDMTIDAMIFDATDRAAYVTRGPACSARWHRFGFQDG